MLYVDGASTQSAKRDIVFYTIPIARLDWIAAAKLPAGNPTSNVVSKFNLFTPKSRRNN